MKAKKFLGQLVAAVCVCSVVLFTGGGTAPSDAGVKVNGKSLGSIYDIVKEATNADL